MAKSKKTKTTEVVDDQSKQETVVDRFTSFLSRRSILSVLTVGIDEENKRLVCYLRGHKDDSLPVVFEDYIVETKRAGAVRPA